jgi:hypothetical protein
MCFLIFPLYFESKKGLRERVECGFTCCKENVFFEILETNLGQDEEEREECRKFKGPYKRLFSFGIQLAFTNAS